jgi:hypothetical protein
MKTKVIFRKYRGGTVIALFPEVPTDGMGELCVLQSLTVKNSVDGFKTFSNTLPASPYEYQELKEKLENMGYTLVICEKWDYEMSKIRREAAFAMKPKTKDVLSGLRLK